jgi:hypothetical protein
MDRAIRFAAADWRDGDKLNRDKLATTISGVLSKTLAAQPSSTVWDATTGKLKLTFKRPSRVFPALGLTDTIEVLGLVAPDKPGSTDQLMLWIGNPVITTTDETAGPKLHLAEDTGADEEGDQKDDNGSLDALAKQFKGQRWDTDNSAWK